MAVLPFCPCGWKLEAHCSKRMMRCSSHVTRSSSHAVWFDCVAAGGCNAPEAELSCPVVAADVVPDSVVAADLVWYAVLAAGVVSGSVVAAGADAGSVVAAGADIGSGWGSAARPGGLGTVQL